MLGVPPKLARLYDTRLEREGIAAEHRPHYRKWLRFYWDFCHKYAFAPTDRQSFPAFHEKLRAKNQSEAQLKQAYHAISLYYETIFFDSPAAGGQRPESAAPPGAEEPSSTAPLDHSLKPSPAREPVTDLPTYPRPLPVLLQGRKRRSSRPYRLSPHARHQLLRRDGKPPPSLPVLDMAMPITLLRSAVQFAKITNRVLLG